MKMSYFCVNIIPSKKLSFTQGGEGGMKKTSMTR